MIPKILKATPRSLALVPLILFVAASVMQCSKKIPVEDLGRARQEIEQAAGQEPKDEALSRLNEARNTLLDAHALLPEEKYGDAADKAVQARKLAMLSRLDSAPNYSLTLKEKASTGLARADEAYAEALAHDDFEAARRLNDEGLQALNEADTIEIKAEQRNDPLADKSPVPKKLEAYRTAFQKLNGSADASEKARAVALSQKPDMLESAGTVEAMLAKAKEYNIEKYDAAGYQEAAGLVQSAREDIGSDKLKSANQKIVAAEGKAAALLEVARKGKATDLLAEATKLSAAAGADYGRASGRMGQADRVKNGEYLKASREALDSSRKRFSEDMFEESIQESRESIRLAALVSEASGVGSREVKPDDGSDTGANKPDKHPQGAGNTYTVKKTHPPDSLWRIAGKKEIYGKGAKWKKIYDANKETIGSDPNLIFPGQELVIPKK